MLDEHAALKGAQEALPGETITDIAVVFPPGTMSAQLGGAAAGAVLGGSNMAGVGNAAANIALDRGEAAASVVLALTPSALHLLGRHRVAPFGSFRHLEPLATIPRSDLKVTRESGTVTSSLMITNTRTGEEYHYEVKPLGSGVSGLIKAVEA